MSGLIYLCRAIGDHHVKIGFSVDPAKRLAELQTGCPYPLRMWAVKPGIQADETYLHRQFNSQNTVGEWFVLTDEMRILARQWRRAYPALQLNGGIHSSAYWFVRNYNKRRREQQQRDLKFALYKTGFENTMSTLELWRNRLNNPHPWRQFREYDANTVHFINDLIGRVYAWNSRGTLQLDNNWRHSFIR